MEKIFALLMVVALFFCGCSRSSSSVDSGSKSTSEQETSNISVNPTVTGQETSNVSVNPTVIGQEIVSLLDARLNKNGYPTLIMGLHSELTYAFGGVSYQCDLYIPSCGMYLYFISDPEDGSLRQFTFYTNYDEILPPSEILQGYILSSLPFFFEPDTWENLSNQLGIGVSSGKGQSFASTGKFEYSYESNETFACFNACALSEESIDIKTLDFANGRITPQKIDWTTSDFIKKLDEYAKKKDLPLLSDTRPVSVEAADLEGLSSDIREGSYYSLGSGVRMYLFTSAEGRLERVEFVTLLNSVTSDSLSRFAYLLTITVNLLDDAQASDILDTIEIDNVSQEGKRLAVGGQMNYSYYVDNKSLLCTISRNSPIVSMSNDEEPANDSEKETEPKIETQPEATNDSDSSNSVSKPPETVKKSKNPYTEGTPRFEGWLCEGFDMESDPTTVKPVNPKTTFKLGETIYLAGRYYGWTGEEHLTFIWNYPDGATDESKRYYMVAGKQESSGYSRDYGSSGQGSLTIIMDSTGQTLATLLFTLTE